MYRYLDSFFEGGGVMLHACVPMRIGGPLTESGKRPGIVEASRKVSVEWSHTIVWSGYYWGIEGELQRRKLEGICCVE